MLKLETNNLDKVNTTNTQEPSNKKLTFLGKTDNKLEQTPNSDTFDNKNKDKKKKIITLSLIGATVVAALIEGIACKGKHIKKLFNKTEKEVKNAEKKAEEKVGETVKEESKKIRKLHKEVKNLEDGTKIIEYKDNNDKVVGKIEYDILDKKTSLIEYRENGTQIETKFYYDGKKSSIKKLYKDGSSTETYFNTDGKTSSIAKISSDGSQIRTYYRFDGKTPRCIEKTSKNGTIETTVFQHDGKKFSVQESFKDGTKKVTYYKEDGIHIDKIEVFDANGKVTKVTQHKNLDEILAELPEPIQYVEDDFGKVEQYIKKYCPVDEDYQHILKGNLDDLKRALKEKNKTDIENILNSIINDCIKDVNAMIEIQQTKTGENILALGKEYRFII